MPLLPNSVQQTLASWSLTQEFTRYQQEYLDLVSHISHTFIQTCQQHSITVTLTPKEDYAEQHLIDKTTIWLLSDNAFRYFRAALRQGLRQYIPPRDYQRWADMMSRYVLHEAIQRRTI